MNKLWTGLAATFIYNSAIAALLTLLLPAGSFAENFIYSQCIGFSIALINTLTLGRMQPGWKRWAALCLTLPLSVAVGLQLAYWVTGCGGSLLHPKSLSALLIVVYIGVFFGILASVTFVLFERIERLNMEVKQRQLDQMESEKRQIEAQLKLLQAQIEPHFLFNTLANVGSLIDADAPLAKKLLERLNDWLRVALLRARSDHTTLGDELDMLENYLQILHIRFGDRLRWQIEADEATRCVKFPPMLLQPLVENAVRHGIEPKLGGGEISIRADIKNAQLHIAVSDSGVGLQANSDKAGTGLENVRSRLDTLFGDAGKLLLRANEKGGVTAALELPI